MAAQHDLLFVPLTRRETLGGGMFPYTLSIQVTMYAVISILMFRQWLISGVVYAVLMTAIAMMQARDEDMFAILTIRTNLWLKACNWNRVFWGARSYDP